MNYVKYPNLPENAKIVLLGEKYAKILEKPLEKLGIEPLFVPDNPSVSDMVSGHADLSVMDWISILIDGPMPINHRQELPWQRIVCLANESVV